MAVKKLLSLYIRNEMIRGLTWTGSGFEGLWVGGTPPPSNFPLGSPRGRCICDDIYLFCFNRGCPLFPCRSIVKLVSKHHPLWLLSIDLPKYTRLCEIVRPHQLINILFTGLPAPLNSLVPLGLLRVPFNFSRTGRPC